MADNIARARYRNGPGKAEVAQPASRGNSRSKMYPTSLVSQHGHRIRLDIFSSNFTRLDIKPDTANR